MDNLKLPAHPSIVEYTDKGIKSGHQINNDNTYQEYGFTKLEKAALMIAQGWLSGTSKDTVIKKDLAEAAVSVAKAVLEEANK